MITPMQQVVIALRKNGSDAVIAALQDAGVLHLRPIVEGPLKTGQLAGQDADVRREDERLLARLESTLAELGITRGAAAPLPAEAEWAGLIETVALPAADLARERQAVQGDLDAVSAYGSAVHALARLSGGLDRSRRVATLPFVLPAGESAAELQAALQAALPERAVMATEVAGNNRVGLIAVLRSDRDAARAAMSQARVGELRLPGRFDQMPLSDAAAEMDRISREAPVICRAFPSSVTSWAASTGERCLLSATLSKTGLLFMTSGLWPRAGSTAWSCRVTCRLTALPTSMAHWLALATP
ncbi:hypothetical protein ACFP81_07090 [Deinococcus lacus]|uniref:V-type ATP synthase subunit I N-terminal domain-containing protein n=1 Tax=Deinococcus lacus TaxID=392561 RepID=A0ABW1YF41_9DEIO